MRTLMIAGLALAAALGATPAVAQHVLSNGQVWMNGHIMPPAPMQPIQQAPQMQQMQMHQPQYHQTMPQPQQYHAPLQPQQYHPMPPQGMPPQGMQHQPRWGGTSGGRWYGGSNAPGGWGAYRAPSRGWSLPRYWIAPSFYIADYGTYGLSSPPQGYSWTRYYDDAVLMDQRGRVWDSVSGIDWDNYDSAYGDDGAQGGGYGTSYQAPQGYAGPSQSYAPPPPVRDGYSSSYSSSASGASGGYASGGYWYPPATTTTVTIQSAPVVTTTTTEYVETTRYVPARRVYHAKRKWVPRRSCNCGCGCR